MDPHIQAFPSLAIDAQGSSNLDTPRLASLHVVNPAADGDGVGHEGRLAEIGNIVDHSLLKVGEWNKVEVARLELCGSGGSVGARVVRSQ